MLTNLPAASVPTEPNSLLNVDQDGEAQEGNDEETYATIEARTPAAAGINLNKL